MTDSLSRRAARTASGSQAGAARRRMSATFITREGRCERAYEERAPDEPKDGISPNLSAKLRFRSSSRAALSSLGGSRLASSSCSSSSCAVLHAVQHQPTEIAPTRALGIAADGWPAKGTVAPSASAWLRTTRDASHESDATRACDPVDSAAVIAT
eukprot:6747132-Prymnesium_polylepis.1